MAADVEVAAVGYDPRFLSGDPWKWILFVDSTQILAHRIIKLSYPKCLNGLQVRCLPSFLRHCAHRSLSQRRSLLGIEHSRKQKLQAGQLATEFFLGKIVQRA